MADSRNNDVLIGRNGWLYLKNGSNELIKYYTQKNKFNGHLINAWHNLLKDRYARFERKSTRYIHIFIPNKLTIYPEYVSYPLNFFYCHPINAFWEGAKLKKHNEYLKYVINPIPYLYKNKTNHLLYRKTDTHWTFWGCYCAYKLICNKIEIPFVDELPNRKYTEIELAMDLGSKLNPAVTEKIKFYQLQKNASRIYANDLVRYKENNGLENDATLHVGSHVIYRNHKVSNSLVVVLFGDSFSGYRTHLLTGMLIETFFEVHFIWSTSIDINYINNVKPDIVITEIVERFMPIVPNNKFNLSRYVKNKMKLLF